MKNILDIKQYDFLKKIQSLNFVEKIILFGSRARQSNKEKADIDLAIVCPTADDIAWFEILEIIEDADTLLKIDCVRFDTLPANSQKLAPLIRGEKI